MCKTTTKTDISHKARICTGAKISNFCFLRPFSKRFLLCFESLLKGSVSMIFEYIHITTYGNIVSNIKKYSQIFLMISTLIHLPRLHLSILFLLKKKTLEWFLNFVIKTNLELISIIAFTSLYFSFSSFE